MLDELHELDRRLKREKERKRELADGADKRCTWGCELFLSA
jgi:hypothetical protein